MTNNTQKYESPASTKLAEVTEKLLHCSSIEERIELDGIADSLHKILMRESEREQVRVKVNKMREPKKSVINSYVADYPKKPTGLKTWTIGEIIAVGQDTELKAELYDFATKEEKTVEFFFRGFKKSGFGSNVFMGVAFEVIADVFELKRGHMYVKNIEGLKNLRISTN